MNERTERTPNIAPRSPRGAIVRLIGEKNAYYLMVAKCASFAKAQLFVKATVPSVGPTEAFAIKTTPPPFTLQSGDGYAFSQGAMGLYIVSLYEYLNPCLYNYALLSTRISILRKFTEWCRCLTENKNLEQIIFLIF